MSSSYLMPVKYTKCKTSVTEYITGISDWDSIEDFYKGQTIRDKVICKIDIMYYFQKYFKKETINKYRPVLLMLAKGLVTDPSTFSNVINDLIKIDSIFAEQIISMFHSCPEDGVFGYYIINCFADTIKNVETDYRNFFRGKPQVVICISDGYLYFSVSDTNQNHILPDTIDCEVISHGKNWNGSFTYI